MLSLKGSRRPLIRDSQWWLTRKEIISKDDYDKLVAYLDKQKSKVRKLRPEEVRWGPLFLFGHHPTWFHFDQAGRFIEASIAYYRGKPVMSDEEYKGLRCWADAGGSPPNFFAALDSAQLLLCTSWDPGNHRQKQLCIQFMGVPLWWRSETYNVGCKNQQVLMFLKRTYTIDLHFI